jgi:hypothetical protein
LKLEKIKIKQLPYFPPFPKKTILAMLAALLQHWVSYDVWLENAKIQDTLEIETLLILLVRPKLEYASCIWDPIYEVHSAKIERVKEKFIREALVGLIHLIYLPMKTDVA